MQEKYNVSLYCGSGQRFWVGFDSAAMAPQGFNLFCKVADPLKASMIISAMVLSENLMTFDSAGAGDFVRSKMVNFEEVKESMYAYELGQAVGMMLAKKETVH